MVTLTLLPCSWWRYVRLMARRLATDSQAWLTELLPASANAQPGPVIRQSYYVLEERPDWAYLRTFTAYFSQLPTVDRHRHLAHVIDNDSCEVVYFASAPYAAPLRRDVENFLGGQGLLLLPTPAADDCPEPHVPHFPFGP